MIKKFLLAALFVFPLVAFSNAYGFVPFGIGWKDGVATYWVNPDNDSGVSEDAVIESIMGGADAWAGLDAQFNFCFQDTTTRRTISRNGFNDIFFRNRDAGGAIAATRIWNFGSQFVEFDIEFFEARFQFFGINDSCSGNGFYIWYIAMHELGHGLGLGHPSDPTAIMFARARRCDPRTELEQDDIDGVQYIYGVGDPPGCN